MGKKPGVGLGVVILVGLSASGCQNSSSGSQTKALPPPVGGQPSAQGWNNRSPSSLTQGGGTGGSQPAGQVQFPTGPGGLTPTAATAQPGFGAGAQGSMGGSVGSFTGNPTAIQTPSSAFGAGGVPPSNGLGGGSFQGTPRFAPAGSSQLAPTGFNGGATGMPAPPAPGVITTNTQYPPGQGQSIVVNPNDVGAPAPVAPWRN